MWYHLIPVQMTIIKKSTNNKCWWGYREKGAFSIQGNVNWYSHSGKQYGVSSKNYENRYTIWSSNSTPRYIFQEKGNTNLKRYMHHWCCISMGSQRVRYHWVTKHSTHTHTHKQIKCPSTEEWIERLVYLSIFVLVLSCVRLFAFPWNVVHQALLSMDFSRQEYCSRLSFRTSRDLSDPGIKPTSLASPTLADRFFTTAPLSVYLSIYREREWGREREWDSSHKNNEILPFATIWMIWRIWCLVV